MKQEERAVQEQLRSRQASLPSELEPGKGHLWSAASNMKTEEARLIPPDPSSSELKESSWQRSCHRAHAGPHVPPWSLGTGQQEPSPGSETSSH